MKENLIYIRNLLIVALILMFASMFDEGRRLWIFTALPVSLILSFAIGLISSWLNGKK
jgi:hypothetical protein